MIPEQEMATLVARSGKPFRILQVTDFHNDQGDGLAQQTYDDVAAMVRHFSPAMLAVTGDCWCSDAEPERAPQRFARDVVFLSGLGVPWGLVWGNHDYAADFPAALDTIAEAPNSLLPAGNPSGAFRVAIHVGEEATPRWDVYFINTREQWRLPQDLDWFLASSRRLAMVRGEVVPALVFCHFPLRNYQEAIDAGRITGAAEEPVLYWGDEDGRAAPLIKEPGNVKAVFCGHSHRNDCWFEEDGVLFAYGRATGHGGYGGETLRKGGKLIELDLKRGRLNHKTVFPDGSTATP